MLLRLNAIPRIEDLRNHPAESVETLRMLLQAGVPARPDPRRRDFYEVDNCSRVFYIHITPRGSVLLLAIWSKDSPEPDIEAGRLAAGAPPSQGEVSQRLTISESPIGASCCASRQSDRLSPSLSPVPQST
jgi:hypothetical protein